MANEWLRLWHDMPNDPKWRSIAKASGQHITAVISVYVHMLVCASNATERGRTQGWSDEDVANALELETHQVTAICDAMQGRVLDGDTLKGWKRRQPIKEDGSSERSKAWRELQKLKKEQEEEIQTKPNETERKRPQDKDKDKDKKSLTETLSNFENFWIEYGKLGTKQKALKAFKKIKGVDYGKILEGLGKYQAQCRALATEQRYIKYASTWLNERGWEDEYPLPPERSSQQHKNQPDQLQRGADAVMRGLAKAEARFEEQRRREEINSS